MQKRINDLVRGDVIRAVIPKNGEHTVIILEDYQEEKHIKCINCCSFSSHPSSKKEKLRYISIEGIKVPDFIFEIKKDFTHMRIDEPICLKRFLIREYLGNLNEVPKFWDLICSEVAKMSMVAGVELDGLCSCDCLKNEGIEPMYCIQEIHQLTPELVEKYKQYRYVTTCPCCWRIIDTSGCAIRCPYCDDNLVAYVHDFERMSTDIWDVER